MTAAAKRYIQRDTAGNEYEAYYRFNGYRNPQLKLNVKTLRRLAKTPLARSAINQIKDGVLALPWHFVSIDGKDHNAEINKLTNILNHPNQIDDYHSWANQELEDMLVLDSGCCETKSVTSSVQPLYLFPIDAGTLEVVVGWDGNPNNPRYAQSVKGEKKYFKNDQIMVMKKNFFTHNDFGISPTETAWKHLQYLINVHEYANDLASNAMPKYLVNIGKDAGEDELRKLRVYIENEVQGYSTLAILASDTLDSKQVSPIGDEAACLSWQKMLIQIISVCYGVPPERLGSAISNDRSTTSQKEEDFVENTIKPWARVIERSLNKHVVERLGLSGKVKFEYIYLPNQSQKSQLADLVLSIYKTDLLSGDEARECLKGVLPIELGMLKDGDLRYSEYKSQYSSVKQETNESGVTNGTEQKNTV